MRKNQGPPSGAAAPPKPPRQLTNLQPTKAPTSGAFFVSGARLMGKIKGTIIDQPAAGAANTPITAANDAATAAAAESAVVVYGRDEANKAHASWFGAADVELAIKAAGMMGMRVLPVTTDEHRAAASKLAAGRIFESGRGFVPFAKEASYKALEALDGAYSPPAPPEPEPEVLVAASSVPATWADLAVGAVVLASPGEDEGWWVAVVTEDRGEGLFVLRWIGFDSEPSFVRRGDDLGLAAPSTVLAELVAEPVGESGETPPAP